jgi:mannose-6-phosphate isomerase
MSGLIAYPGPDPAMPLLQESGEQMTKSAGTSALRSPKPKEIVEAQT